MTQNHLTWRLSLKMFLINHKQMNIIRSLSAHKNICLPFFLAVMFFATIGCHQNVATETEEHNFDSICSPGFFWRDGVYANFDLNLQLNENGEMSGFICRNSDSSRIDTIQTFGNRLDGDKLLFQVGAIVVEANCKDKRFMTYEGLWKSPNGSEGVFFVSRDEGKDAVKQRELQKMMEVKNSQINIENNTNRPTPITAGGSDAKIQYAVTSTRNLHESELANLSANDLRIIRNEIYARHGRMFKSTDLRNYFSKYSWYNVLKSYDDKTIEKEFNSYEKHNVELLFNVQKTLESKKQDKSTDSPAQQPIANVLEPDKNTPDTNEGISLNRLLSTNELQAMTYEELGYLRNEIYARHGLEFKTPKTRNYFNQFDWYRELPKYNNVTNKLTDIDRKNIETIKEVEAKKK